MPRLPNRSIENSHGGIVIGIDEAGCGPWAGPVVAAAVWLNAKKLPKGIDDCKRVTKEDRIAIYETLIASVRTATGLATVEEIDTLNILGGVKLAMQRAYEALGVVADLALIDGNRPPVLSCKTMAIVGGDGRSLSIAAASIVAKVTRDRLMADLAEQYPGYGFDKHWGYGTKAHQKALAERGPCALHRKSFAPIQELLAAGARDVA